MYTIDKRNYGYVLEKNGIVIGIFLSYISAEEYLKKLLKKS